MKAGVPQLKWLHEFTGNERQLPAALRQVVLLSNRDYPIPFGFIVPNELFHYTLQESGLKEIYSEELLELQKNKRRGVSRTSQKLRNHLKGTTLTSDIKNTLETAFNGLIKHLKLDDHTLRITPYLKHTAHDQIIDPLIVSTPNAFNKAVVHLFAEALSQHSLASLAYHDLQLDDLSLYLLVQPYRPAIRSGSVTLQHDLAICQTVWGEIEPLTNKQLPYDTLTIDLHSHSVIQRDISKQTWQLAYQQKKLKQIAVPRLQQSETKLNDLEAIGLTQLAERIQQEQPGFQCFSWFADQKHQIWINPDGFSKHQAATQTEETSEVKTSISPAPLVRGKSMVVGRATGPIRIIREKKQLDRLDAGDIAVVETLPLWAEPIVRTASAIVCESTRPSKQLLETAQELGVPIIIGAGKASHLLRDGAIATVDGYTGEIHNTAIATESHNKGCQSCNTPQSTVITGTKIFLYPKNLEELSPLHQAGVDGVAVLPAQFVLAELGQHPKTLLHSIGSKAFTQKIFDILYAAATSAAPLPLIYSIADLDTLQYRDLPGGYDHEARETNPLMGYRGAIRHLREPEILRLELEAIRRLREDCHLTNIQVAFSYVRTADEYHLLKGLTAHSGLFNEHNFRIWLNCQLPSTIYLLDDLCQEDALEGILIDVAALSQHILGVDLTNEKLVGEYSHNDTSILRAIEEITDKAFHAGVPVIVLHPEIYNDPDFMTGLLSLGITGLSADLTTIPDLRQLVASAEQRLILDHVVNELHQEHETA